MSGPLSKWTMLAKGSSLSYMLLIPGDSGVNSLPLYTKRGHSHLGCMGCTKVFYRALSLSAYCPYASGNDFGPTQHMDYARQRQGVGYGRTSYSHASRPDSH